MPNLQEELINSAGFSSSSYEVETEDFYRLKLHRIRVKNRSQSQQTLGPVFFMHGLFATAADYLMTGANTALRKIQTINLQPFGVHLLFSLTNLYNSFYITSISSLEQWIRLLVGKFSRKRSQLRA